MKPFRSVVTAIALAIPGLALAQQAAPSASPAPAAKSNDPVVCRTDNVLGSRIATRKICLKVSEWHRVAQESGDWAEHKETYLGKPGGG